MENSGKKKTEQGWMSKVSKHPLILLGGLVVAVVALAVMIILFFISQTERELVYAVNPVKTRVVAMEKATGLEIRHKGLELGNVDITAAQVAIWNSGDESIRKGNVLREVVIFTEPPVNILEVSIVKSSRELEITNLDVLESPELMNVGRVAISWDILEKDDGASIQLIYLGSPEVEIKTEGLIEGGGEIKRVGREVKIKTPTEQFKAAETPWWGYLFVVGMAIFLTVYVGRELRRIKKEGRKFMISAVVMIFAVWSMVAFLFWESLLRGPLGPPFGF